MRNAFTHAYQDYLVGTYDCVDRIVLNAYFPLGHSPSGFRHWWRQLHGSDATLDDTHLMRMAGRFSRRLHAYAKAHQLPILYCEAGERKHEIAEQHLAQCPAAFGVFLILVARAQAPLWQVQRGENGYLNLTRKKHLPYVNHYHFHIYDPDWGHITIKICGHPPFAAQVMLNGHEYVAAQLRKADHPFQKEGNCFTDLQEGSDLALVADALRQEDAIGHLSQVCQRWIYSACLCFALSSEEQEQSGFCYQFSIYQIEYSHNLHFRHGSQMEHLFESVLDRTRSLLDVPRIKTILGVKKRPYRHKRRKSASREEIVVEKPVYNLSVFKVHFGALTFKGYTKGERTLRFEAIVHNTRDLGCGRVLSRFPQIVACLQGLLERFLQVVRGVEAPFLADATWDQLPTPSQVGACRVGGVDVHKPRMRAVLGAVLSLAAQPVGFTASEVADKVCHLTGQSPQEYGPTRAAYDLKKLRGKHLIVKVQNSHRYTPVSEGVQTMAALWVLREQVLKPLLAGVTTKLHRTQSDPLNPIDACYEALRTDMHHLLDRLGFAA